MKLLTKLPARLFVIFRHVYQMQGDHHPRYGYVVCWFMNLVDLRAWCEYECEWIPPYGFVANAKCPYHD
jgi:hypothetical protein